MLCVNSPHEVAMTRANQERTWQGFLLRGTGHSGNASTLPYIIRRCELEKVPYRLSAMPGVGYFIEPAEKVSVMKGLWKPISELTDLYQQPLMIASPELIDGDSNPLGISDGFWQDTVGLEKGEWVCVGFDMCNDEFTTRRLKLEDVTHFLIPEGPYEETPP